MPILRHTPSIACNISKYTIVAGTIPVKNAAK
jgi:hypothetical protein